MVERKVFILLEAVRSRYGLFIMTMEIKTKIAITSDIHGIKFPIVEECDLLLIAGDVAPDYFEATHYIKPNLGKQRSWIRNEFNVWLNNVPAKEIVWIAGNHDFVCQEPGFNRTAEQLNAHYLCDSEIELFGFKIYGTPWVPNLKNWAFYADDPTLAEKTRSIPSDTDILISHGPPNGFGDKVTYGNHVGNSTLTNWISFNQPKLVVCGHIHEAQGIFEMGETNLINASFVDEDYAPTDKVFYLSL